MESSDVQVILQAFLDAQKQSNDLLLKVLGYRDAEPVAVAAQPVDEPVVDQLTYFPDVEFDQAMESPELWPQPDVYRLTDIPRRVETVGEIE